MPLEVSFSFDGTKAFVCNNGSNNVSVINVTTKSVISTINVGNGPVGAWQAANNKMIVDSEDSKSITIIDVATLAIDQTMPLTFTPGMAMHQKDYNEIWITNPTNGTVQWLKWDRPMTMYMPGGEFNVGAGAHAIVFSGTKAFITNQTAGTLAIVDIENHNLLKTINVGVKPNGLVSIVR